MLNKKAFFNVRLNLLIRRLVGYVLLGCALSLLFVNFARSQGEPFVSSKAVSQYLEIASNRDTFYIAIHFRIQPDWHLYWENPGDSGLAPVVNWGGSRIFALSPLEWQLPEIIKVGPLVNYGYSKELWLLYEVKLRQPVTKGDLLEFVGKVEYLVCKEDCLPGEANLSLAVKVSDQDKISSDYQFIQQAKDRLPSYFQEFETRANLVGDLITISITPPVRLSDPYFFPRDQGLVQNLSEQQFSIDQNRLELRLPKTLNFSETIKNINGLLVGFDHNKERKGYVISAPLMRSEVASDNKLPFAAVELSTSANQYGALTLLFFAFVGGLILNLMPCVFPVLSIKVLSLVKSQGVDKQKIKAQSLAFSLGVIFSFMIVALALYVARFFGAEVGWGFQLQSPRVIFVLAILFFVLALNFFGAFEIGQGLQNYFGKLRYDSQGILGSFFSGLLAVVIASPCSAPFMGVALAGAILSSPFFGILIFCSLGIGMSLPYLLIGLVPQVARFLPKPGAWVVTFKEFMAYPLLATVLWLITILHKQSGFEGVFLLLIAFCVVIFVTRLSRDAKAFVNLINHILFLIAVLLLVFFTYLVGDFSFVASIESKISNQESLWRQFSAKSVSEELAKGRSVFIDFTAQWCITCQVNKRLILRTDYIQELFLKNNVTLFVADWTGRDPEITRALEAVGRNSVPTYLFIKSQGEDPRLLPSILTQGMIEELFK
ncbi:MAG TPA: protein-disulfide reductase DsbD family protein [Oligoflexia bacterium]|nr:protein-disulfide reductase DsbD family protein [Oligoflexia bacterium]